MIDLELDFPNEFFPTRKENGYWNYVRRDGRWLNGNDYLAVFPFDDKFGRVCKKNGYLTFIDCDGKEPIDEEFRMIFPKRQEIYLCQLKNKKWNFLDSDLKFKFSENFAWASEFINDSAVVLGEDGKIKIVDKFGNLLEETNGYWRARKL